MRALIAAFGLAVLALALPGSAAAQAPPPPETLKLTDDVYVYRNSGYNSLIILSSAVVLITEPASQFNTERSNQLKAEIAKLSSQPVRWVVFSHDHRDHNEGGHVFADTATFISHRGAAGKIAQRNDPRSPVPTVLFDERLQLDVGGKRVDLVYLGRNHSDNSLVVFYAAARLIHAVDWAEAGRLPFRALGDTYLDEWLVSLQKLENDFDYTVLVPGHTGMGSKTTVRALREYFGDLFVAIRGGRVLGHGDRSTFMTDYVRYELAPKYRTWGNFNEHLAENIEGVTRIWAAR